MKRYCLSTALQCIVLLGYYVFLTEVLFGNVIFKIVPLGLCIEFLVPFLLIIGWLIISERRKSMDLTTRDKWRGLFVRIGTIAVFLLIGMAMELSAGKGYSIGLFMLHNFAAYLIISGYVVFFALAEFILHVLRRGK